MIPSPLARVRGASRFLTGSGGNLVHRVIRSGAWVGAQNLGQNLLQTGRTIVLARLLTPDVFGLMSLCQIGIRGLELFTETGIAPALIHRQDRVDEARDTAFTLQVARGVLLALLTIPLAPAAAWFYEDPRLQPAILALATVFVIGGCSNINTVLLQKQLDFRRLTMLELSVALTSTIVVVALAYYLRSLWALVIGQILTSTLRLVLSYVIVPGRARLRFDPTIARELFRYGRFITGLTMVLFLTAEIGNMVVGKILDVHQLGYYTMAFTLANLPATHIAKIASSVIFPAYSTLQKDPIKIRLAFLTVLRVVAGLAFPAAAGLAALAPEIVTIVYGPKWAPAVNALRILALFGAARAVGMLGGYLYNAIGKPNISFYITATKLAVILAVIYPATATYGLEGAAYAAALPQVIGDTIALVIVRGEIGLSLGVIFRALGRVLAGCAVMVAAVLGLRLALEPIGPADLALLVGAGALVYGLVSLPEMKSLYGLVMRRSSEASAPPAGLPATEPPAAPAMDIELPADGPADGRAAPTRR
jgi:lipopolysaccharide exporter